jgi:hypothetical protein
MSYQPWVGKLEDGTEVLVTVQKWHDHDGMSGVQSIEVAFRAKPHHTWGPPTLLERAP